MHTGADKQMTEELRSLCNITSSDFSALSRISNHDLYIRWRHVFGNISDRYKQMLVKPGLGPGGLTLRTGKPTLWTKLLVPPSNLQMECPLIVSERLHAAAAVPIMEGDKVCGVLLVARRSSNAYDSSELTALHQHIQRLEAIIEPA